MSLSPVQRKAALLLGRGYTLIKAARAVDRSRDALNDWRADPEFVALVEAESRRHVDQMRRQTTHKLPAAVRELEKLFLPNEQGAYMAHPKERVAALRLYFQLSGLLKESTPMSVTVGTPDGTTVTITPTTPDDELHRIIEQAHASRFKPGDVIDGDAGTALVPR